VTHEFQAEAMPGTSSEPKQKAGAAGSDFDEKPLAADEPSGASADHGIEVLDDEDQNREADLAEDVDSWDGTSRDQGIGADSTDTIVAHIADALDAPAGDIFLRAVMAALDDGNATGMRTDEAAEEAATATGRADGPATGT